MRYLICQHSTFRKVQTQHWKASEKCWFYSELRLDLKRPTLSCTDQYEQTNKKKGLFRRHTSKWKKHFKLSHCCVTHKSSHTQNFLFIAKTQLLLFNIEELALDESSPTQMFPRKPAGAFRWERETLQAKQLILVSKHGGSQNGGRGPQLDLRDTTGDSQRLSTLQENFKFKKKI